MASTITLNQTVNFAQTYCRLQPLTGVGGVDTEPAVSIANMVKQFILAPPFGWPWNRNTKTFITVAGTQDYTVSVTDFGWLEKASVTDTTQKIWPLTIELVSGDSTDAGRPTNIAPQMDDGAGNITFRLYPVPDGVYTVKLIYQRVPLLMTATTQTWVPIPDQFAYLYTSGFLASALEMVDDARFAPQQEMFLRQLVAACSGLDETQKNIFIESRLRQMRQQQASTMSAEQGRQGRG